jgi:DNA-binding XRE family transcriptional regulator
MSVSSSQLQAARAILNIDQSKLARWVEVSPVTI